MRLANPRLSRFKSLFLSLFLLFIFIGSILTFNYYANTQIDRNSGIIDGIGEMSDQLYNITLEVQKLNVATPNEKVEAISYINETKEEINTLMGLLDEGGRYVYDEEYYIDVSPITDSRNRENYNHIKDLWQNYQVDIDKAVAISESNTGAYSQSQDLKELSQNVYDIREELYEEIDIIYVDRFADIEQWTRWGKWVLISGIIFISLYLLWFVTYFLRKLLKSEEYLDKAREQNQEILSTIHDGLFLIDEDLVIAEQYSDVLEDFLNQKQIAGKTLIEVISPLVSEKDLEEINSFVKQLYSSWVVEDLIEQLNPLKNVRVATNSEDGSVVTRYLDFNFNRVTEDDEIIRILVTVIDNTEALLLEERLSAEKLQNDRQIEMISNLINIDSEGLKEFLEATKIRIDNINKNLKVTGSQQSQMRQKAQYIYRQAHSIKGDASAMRLLPFIDLMHALEDTLKQINEKSQITGNDFIPLAVTLDELINLVDFVEDLASRLNIYDNSDGNLLSAKSIKTEPLDAAHITKPNNSSESQQVNPTKDDTDKAIDSKAASMLKTKRWHEMTKSIAERLNKQVKLHTNGFDTLKSTKEFNMLLNQIVTQLLRNSVVHGIESPEDRKRIGKPEQGNIYLDIRPIDNNTMIQLVIEDDGRGIDFDKIKQKALTQGLITSEQTISQQQLLKFMFFQGFSTAQSTTEDAGRGVGMDIIRSAVKDNNGKLSIKTAKDEFTRFTILFPKP